MSDSDSDSDHVQDTPGARDFWIQKTMEVARDAGYQSGVASIDQSDCSPEDCDLDSSLTDPEEISSLRSRFLCRLAILFSKNAASETPTVVFLREDENPSRVSIRILGVMSNLPKSNKKMDRPSLENLARLLRATNAERFNPRKNKCREDLWTLVFLLFKKRLQLRAGSLKRVLISRDNYTQFDTLASGDTGLFTASMSVDDRVIPLATALVSLHKLVRNFEKKRTSHVDFRKIIDQAHRICLLPLWSRAGLKQLLTPDFAEKLYNHVILLALPKSIWLTLIKSAVTFDSFANVWLEYGLPKVSPCAQPSHQVPQMSYALEDGKAIMEYTTIAENLQPTRESPTTVIKFQYQQNDIDQFLAPALDYLPAEDREQGLVGLTANKRVTLFLVASALHNTIPRESWEAYYAFGFASCKPAEIEVLGDLYHFIISRTKPETNIFADLCFGIENSSLTHLFDCHGWSSYYRTKLPELEEFLKRPAHDRESAFRLVQFLRDKGNTDPPPVLIRDYGFYMCKQLEEVELLKAHYFEVLPKLGPKGIHNACVMGLLREVISAAGVKIDPRCERLLTNQWWHRDIGLDRITSTFDLGDGLFREDVFREDVEMLIKEEDEGS